MDINTKALKKNAFRVTKERGVTASRIRVPGGHLDAKYLSQIQHIAETFGNGTVHITSRQGFEIPGIPFEKMPEVTPESNRRYGNQSGRSKWRIPCIWHPKYYGLCG